LKKNCIIKLISILFVFNLITADIYSMQESRKRKSKSSEEKTGRRRSSDEVIIQREVIYVHKEWRQANSPITVITNDWWRFVVPQNIFIELGLFPEGENIIGIDVIYLNDLNCFEFNQFLLTYCVAGKVEVDLSDILDEICGDIKSLKMI